MFTANILTSCISAQSIVRLRREWTLRGSSSAAARTQPPQRQSRPAPQPADRLHRRQRLGKAFARLRHALRRGPAALRRIAVELRPAVPRPAAEARRRLPRRPVAGHQHPAEDGRPQPALDRRHHHRDLTTTCASSTPASARATVRVRPADHGPDARADHRPHPGAAGGHAVPGPRSGGPRPEGRVQGPLRGHAQARLRPCPRRWPGRASSTDDLKLDKRIKHDIEIVIDRLKNGRRRCGRASRRRSSRRWPWRRAI